MQNACRNNYCTVFFKGMPSLLCSNYIEWTQTVIYTTYILHITATCFGYLNFKRKYISHFLNYIYSVMVFEIFETCKCDVQNIGCVFDCLHSIFMLSFLNFVFYLLGKLKAVTCILYVISKRIRWSRGSVLAFSTQVRGFKPGRNRRIFRA